MAGRVQPFDFDVSDADLVAGIVTREVAFADPGHHADPVRLGAVSVHFARVQLQKLWQPGNGEAEERAAYMIRVVMRTDGAGNRHSVGGRRVHDTAKIPRRIDHQTLSRVSISDEIDEILHLLTEEALLADVAT